MKKKTVIYQLSILVFAAMMLFSCKTEQFTKEFSIKDNVIEFDVEAAAAKGTDSLAEEVLYEGILSVNVAQLVEQSGFSFDHIKSFVILQGSVELVAPIGFSMNHFIGMKLYFENRDQLVAQADMLGADGVLKLSIVNGDLLDKLKENNLRVIITGVRPPIKVRLRLRTDYAAEVSLIK